MDNILIVGAGKIGTILYTYMGYLNINVEFADINPANSSYYTTSVNLKNSLQIKEILIEENISCLINTSSVNDVKSILAVIELCNALKINYIDIHYNEQVEEAVALWNLDINVILGTGLAPGIVNLIAADLVNNTKLEYPHLLEAHVGSLSRDTDNAILLVPTYAVDALCDEYNSKAKFVNNGQVTAYEPFKNGMKKDIIINDLNYEAFVTAGGFSTFFDTFKDKIPNIIYRSLKKPGHYGIVSERYVSRSFVALPPKDADDILVQFDMGNFYTDVENTTIENVDDIVIMYVTLGGLTTNGIFSTEYTKLVFTRSDFKYGSATDNLISLGIVTALRAILLQAVNNKGIVKYEDIPYNILTSTFETFNVRL